MTQQTSTLAAVQQQGAYKRLADAIAVGSRHLAVVIGSGLSSPAIDTWNDLYLTLKKELESQALQSDAQFDTLSPVLEKLDVDDLSYWERFEAISGAIPTAYRNIIRNEIGKSQGADIPDLHQAIWKLPIRGVLSLNLDTFARRSIHAADPQGEVKIERGKDAGRLQRILNSPHHFLYELHGEYDDEASWVMTRSALKSLYNTPGYTQFLNTVFTQFHVLFLGISADDIAIGGPLEQLASQGIEGPEHFWITSRSDRAATDWSERARVERISYPEGQHHLVLGVINALSKVQAEDSAASPVARVSTGISGEIPTPEELASRSTAEIRISLNSYANFLLATKDRATYDHFLREYDELVDRAWYVPPKANGYRLFEYRLEPQQARGAFGTVYRATDPNGEVLALKLLKREIRHDLPLLHAFRRGVSAMKILEDRKVPGMVSYRDASEIPTFVTMEWIEGPNLATAKEAKLLDDWRDILDVFRKATKIVLDAHHLPEQVLHRDLRPANIMLRNGWVPDEAWDVVVLDFDLATYVGAVSESVLAEGSALGYLAPEQMVPKRGASSRNAYVDSFGLGMTLYYLCGGVAPDAYFHRDVNFERKVIGASRTPEGASYAATSRRVARLIMNATREVQRERWSVAMILREVERLWGANFGAAHALDADLVAEEIAARCAIISDRYQWDVADDAASYHVANGPAVRIGASPSDRTVSLALEWLDKGTENRSNVARYLQERVDKARQRLESAGWRVEESRQRRRQAKIAADAPVSVDVDAASLGGALNEAIEILTF